MLNFPTNTKYNIIYADPPWKYSNKTWQGTAERHYKTMSQIEICNLPISRITEDDCVLFLWATYPMLGEALEVIPAWGFTYKTLAFQWVKQNPSGNGYFFGIGTWTRSNTEPCLLAVKGKPKRLDNSISQLIFSPRRKHSQKPDIVRDKIVQLVGDLPRIELFARQRFPNWDSWGLEVGEDCNLEKNGVLSIS